MFFVAMTLEIKLPTAGVLLVVGLVCAGTSLYFAWAAGFWYLVGMIIAYVLSLPTLGWVFKKLWPYSPVGRVTEGAVIAPAVDRQLEAKQMVGKKGKVIVELRPGGTIAVGEKRLSATSKSGTIAEGEVVQIVEVKMNHYYVLPSDWVQNEFVSSQQTGGTRDAQGTRETKGTGQRLKEPLDVKGPEEDRSKKGNAENGGNQNAISGQGEVSQHQAVTVADADADADAGSGSGSGNSNEQGSPEESAQAEAEGQERNRGPGKEQKFAAPKEGSKDQSVSGKFEDFDWE